MRFIFAQNTALCIRYCSIVSWTSQFVVHLILRRCNTSISFHFSKGLCSNYLPSTLLSERDRDWLLTRLKKAKKSNASLATGQSLSFSPSLPLQFTYLISLRSFSLLYSNQLYSTLLYCCTLRYTFWFFTPYNDSQRQIQKMKNFWKTRTHLTILMRKCQYLVRFLEFIKKMWSYCITLIIIEIYIARRNLNFFLSRSLF